MSYVANLYPGKGNSRATRNAIEWNAEADRRRAATSEYVPSLRSLQEEESQEAADQKVASALAIKQAQDAEEARIQREISKRTILTAPDSERVLGDAPMSMSWEEAEKFNSASWNSFHFRHPEWHGTAANVEALKNYFSVNHIQIISEAAFEAAFKKLTASGHITTRQVVPAAPETVASTRAAVPAGPQIYKVENYDWNSRNIRPTDLISGWDLSGSNERVVLSAREIDRLSADDYKVFAHIGRS